MTLLLGIAVGVAVMAIAWPAIPAGSTLPQRSDIRVSLSNGYLTRVVQTRLSSHGVVSIRDLQVQSAPPVMVVRAEAGIGPFSAPITVELQPVAASSAVQVRIVATRIGIVPVPNILTGLVAGSINDSLRHALGANATVTGVSVTKRGLDITANYA